MRKQIKPTDAELDILRVLWEHGPGTVRRIHEHMPDKPVRGYTTVLKLLQIMSDKGLVVRDEKQRAHIYKAAVTAEQVQGKMLKHILDKAFGNSSYKLVMQALETRPASSQELAEIRRLLDKIEGESK